ncbi:histidine kinase dimerization/phosphoacceptor domain -containing protein [Rhodospirillaceae bacterium SYSU D60014]|uniref:sensor histidine kinase n=1 Tax=Virgifigura deserti TaxID=2268457 RepID=UPI000E66C3E2
MTDADRNTSSGPDIVPQEQATIASFGDHALRTEDLQSLLQEAAVLAARCLRTEKAEILELLPDHQGLLVRAGCGWEPEVVGKAIIGVGLKSPAGFALQSGQPVISECLSREARFEIPALLDGHGIKSAANVIIGGRDTPFGVLEVDSNETRNFTDNDVDVLRGYANLLAAAIERLRSIGALKAAAEELQAATAEKALLLRELQHRVKNNLQTVTSVVHLQQALADSPEVRASLETVANRLRAMSLLHSQLYALHRTNTIELDAYLRELCENLLRTAGDNAEHIKLDMRLDRMIIAVDTGLPLGLIVNEFIANSLKHAFTDRRGTIIVTLKSAGDQAGELVLADDGIGQPRSGDLKKGSGLGLRLMQRLADQIDGTLEWRLDRGTEARVAFRR